MVSRCWLSYTILGTYIRSMKLKGRTRTFLELRVGPVHSVDIVLHVRACHSQWFESLTADNDSVWMNLLSSTILPRHFESLMVRNMSKHLKQAVPPDNLGPGGREVPVQGAAFVLVTAAVPAKKGKRKRGGKAAAAAAAAAAQLAEKAKQKDVYYASDNKDIELSYRLQDISTSPTLVFSKGDDSNSKGNKMQSLIKLPQRILLWCAPVDYEADGFLRPEMIPMVDIFREPIDEPLAVKKVVVVDD